MGILRKDRDLTKPLRQVELRVDASYFRARWEGFEMRLDAFLAAHMTWRSRTSIQDMIKHGYVLIDTSTAERPDTQGALVPERKSGRKLRHGTRVVVIVPEEQRAPTAHATSDELSVLFDDGAVLAVDKPAGVTVHPSGRHLTDTLIQRVHAVYGRGLELETAGAPRLCHRLDRETSGIVIVGLVPSAHSDVQQQFERREIQKEYLTIVHGVPRDDDGVVDAPIGASRASRIELKMAITVDGQPCKTNWRVVERFADCALVSCEPVTGRQHQIRVHMASLGHPVVGDKLYGDDDELFEKHLEGTLTLDDLRLLGMARHALHNHRLVFRSTVTGERVEVVSPLPPDMRAYLDERRAR